MATITKKKFNEYRRVQFSGVTNMYAVHVVVELSGLTREECRDIMKNYEQYEKQFGKFDGVSKRQVEEEA